MEVLAEADLPLSRIARQLVGNEHDIGVCLFFLDAPPGDGPSLHTHPYEEVLIVTEGEATFTDGERQRVVRAGEMAIVPAGEPHGFVNSGDGPLRQIDIHVNPTFETEWL